MPDAIKVMMEFIRDVPIKGPQKPYDPGSYEIRAVGAYGGFSGPMPPGGPPMGGPPMGGPGMHGGGKKHQCGLWDINLIYFLWDMPDLDHADRLVVVCTEEWEWARVDSWNKLPQHR